MSRRPARPPGQGSRSTTVTSRPRPARCSAAARPAKPGTDHDDVVCSPSYRAHQAPPVAVMRRAVVHTPAISDQRGPDQMVNPTGIQCFLRAIHPCRRSAPQSIAPRRSRRSSCASDPGPSSSRRSVFISSPNCRRVDGVGHFVGCDHHAGGFVFQQISAVGFAGGLGRAENARGCRREAGTLHRWRSRIRRAGRACASSQPAIAAPISSGRRTV